MGADSSTIQHPWLKALGQCVTGLPLNCAGAEGPWTAWGSESWLSSLKPRSHTGNRPSPLHSGGPGGELLSVSENSMRQRQPAAPCFCPHQGTGRQESWSSSGAQRDTGLARLTSSRGDSAAMLTRNGINRTGIWGSGEGFQLQGLPGEEEVDRCSTQTQTIQSKRSR